MAAPLGVVAGLIDPQLPPVHVTDQFTPRLAGSLRTVATIWAAANTFIEDGGSCVIETETGGMMVTVAVAVADGSAVEVAVRVTVAPDGMEPGAV